MDASIATPTRTMFWLGRTRTLVAVGMSAYHLWTGFFGTPVGEVHFPLHLLLALVVLFLAQGAEGPARPAQLLWDFALIAVALAATGYLFINAEYVTQRMLFVDPLTTTETLLAIGLLLVVIEAARRTMGWVLVIVLLVFVAYALLGQYLPGALWHRGYSLEAVLEYSYLTNEGIFGAPLGVMANYVFHFVLFGSLLVASGAGNFFTNLARALTARARWAAPPRARWWPAPSWGCSRAVRRPMSSPRAPSPSRP